MKRTILLSFFSFLTYTLVAQNYNVSEEEALTAGKAVEAAVKRGDANFISNFFDLDALTSAIKEKSVTAQKSGPLFDGFKSTFTMAPLGKQMVETLQKGSYEMIRSYEADNKMHLLFRAFAKTGLNYHDYHLIKVNNIVKAEDVYTYTTGENISATVADLVDAAIQPNTDFTEMPYSLRMVLKLKNYKTKNDYNAIIKLYDSLDDDLKANKGVQLTYISACQKLGVLSDKYKNALENYASIFSDAPNTHLMMIDLYFLNKEYDKSLDAINKLDSFVHDPFLDFYRANLYLVTGDKQQAKTYYDKAFEKYPAMSYIIKNVVILHMNDGEKSIAKANLEIYKKTEGFKQEYVDDIYLLFPELKD